MAASMDAQQAGCISEMKAIIGACKGGLPYHRLERDFRETIGTRIEYVQFGFPTLAAFLRSIPEIRLNGDTLTVYDPKGKMAHITDMVSKQKTVKKRMKPTYQTGRMGGNRYSSGPRKPSYAPQRKSYGGDAPRFNQASAAARLASKPLISSAPKPYVSSAPKPYVSSAPKPYVSSAPNPYVSSAQKPLISNPPKPSVPAASFGQRTRDGGMVLSYPPRPSYSKGRGGSSFTSTLKSVEKKMISAALEEQENIPCTQKDEEKWSNKKDISTRHTMGESKYEYSEDEQTARSPAPAAIVNKPVTSYSSYTEPSSSQLNSHQIAPKINAMPLNVKTPVETPAPASIVKTTVTPLLEQPLSVMDSNLPPLSHRVPDNVQSEQPTPRLTPSQRLQRIRSQNAREALLPTPVQLRNDNSQTRNVVGARDTLTVQFDNLHLDYQSHNNQDVTLEYDNEDYNNEYSGVNYGSNDEVPEGQGEISYTPDLPLGFDARYVLLKPLFKSFQLIGDSYFLNMVMSMESNDINAVNYSRHTIRVDGKPFRCGLCISGLTLEDCFNQLLKFTVFRERVVLMVGAVDVMQGKTFVSMKLILARVIEYLLEHDVSSLVICTLPPILTANHKQRGILMEFNEYINHMATGSKRIFCFNIFYKFLLKDCNMDETLFESEPTTLDVGKVVKVHLWSQKGCRMVMHELDKFLGDLTQ